MTNSDSISLDIIHLHVEIRHEAGSPIAEIVEPDRSYTEYVPRFDITLTEHPVVFHCAWPEQDIRSSLLFHFKPYTRAVEIAIGKALTQYLDAGES